MIQIIDYWINDEWDFTLCQISSGLPYNFVLDLYSNFHAFAPNAKSTLV